MTSLARRLSAFAFVGTILSALAVAQQVDRVTGGGFITPTASGGHGSFGLTVRNPSNPSGQLTYVDHGTQMRVRSTSITAYTIVDPQTRRIEGTCTVNGVGGFTFVATVADVGEPGTLDIFGITLSSGYIAHDRLAGGNIQLHAP